MSAPNPIDVVNALNGITKKWLEVMTANTMFQELKTILASISHHTPAECDIFNFARHSLDNVKVVVIGMDPYPVSGDADGYSFSTKSKVCPASLARIYSVLIKEKLLRAAPTTFDLSYLAAQGFVLLNAALTVEPQRPGSHIKLWSSWTDQLIQNLSAVVPDGTIWCLWGADAQKKSGLIATRHVVLTHCHPIAMQIPNFGSCTHFRTIADKHPEIVWDPSETETHFYTDCSARGNQFKDCKASYGVVCTRGLFKSRTWGGEIFSKQIMFQKEMVAARPTNIRGEGEALIKALQLARTLPRNTKIRIYSDSKFWIVDMLEKYIPDWVERNADFTNKKNSDLVEKFWNLAQLLKSSVTFKFVHAWHDRDRPADGTEDQLWWLGNQAAERAAEHALGL